MSDRNAERNPLKRNTLLLLLSAAVLLAIAAATLLLPGSATAPRTSCLRPRLWTRAMRRAWRRGANCCKP